MPQEGLDKLKEFFEEIEKDIDTVVSKLDLVVPEQKDLNEDISAVWYKEVKPRFKDIRDNLQGKGRMTIEEVSRQLQERGLTGIQLALKLRIYGWRKEEFKEEWAEFEKASEKAKKRKKGVIRGFLGKLLSVIKDILRSLGFIPGPEAVEEFMEVLKEVVS